MLVYAFGNDITYTPYEMVTKGDAIKAAYTYTVDSVNYVGYLVYKENGVKIGDYEGRIYPLVAVSINLSDDSISSSKVISFATTYGYEGMNSGIEQLIKSFEGKSATEVAAYTSLSDGGLNVVSSATKSSNGLYKYVVEACNQYITNDKVNLVNNGGAE